MLCYNNSAYVLFVNVDEVNPVIIREIEAKSILGTVKQPDPIFGLKYNFNLYRGCQHQCIYCDSRSECYQIENFDREILVKKNALDLLEKELANKRVKGVIGTGSMNDPYMPIEAELNLTGRALQVIEKNGFGVHVITKSDLVLRDIPYLINISKTYAAVTFTITTTNDELARKLEPGAPLPSSRLRAIEQLSANGIYSGVSLMPVLPFIEDTAENIANIVSKSASAGAKYIIAWFSVTMRDRQREYYYRQLDRIFPGLKEKYIKTYGNQYGCVPTNSKELWSVFHQVCASAGVAEKITPYHPLIARQMVFDLE